MFKNLNKIKKVSCVYIKLSKDNMIKIKQINNFLFKIEQLHINLL